MVSFFFKGLFELKLNVLKISKGLIFCARWTMNKHFQFRKLLAHKKIKFICSCIAIFLLSPFSSPIVFFFLDIPSQAWFWSLIKILFYDNWSFVSVASAQFLFKTPFLFAINSHTQTAILLNPLQMLKRSCITCESGNRFSPLLSHTSSQHLKTTVRGDAIEPVLHTKYQTCF